MEVTNVRIRPLDREGPTKAFCSILLDGQFAVHDLRVVEGKNGLFVAMPSRRLETGQYRDVAHATTSAMREAIQQRVIEAYRDAMSRSGARSAAAPAAAGTVAPQPARDAEPARGPEPARDPDPPLGPAG